jgi:hypothetical protein
VGGLTSTRSQRRRIGRLRDDLRQLRPPERQETLADLGDPVLVQLAQQLLDQEWLDQVERAEWLAKAEAGIAVSSRELTPKLDFERDGVRRLPMLERLRLARLVMERDRMLQGLPVDHPQPPVRPVPAPPAQVEEVPTLPTVATDDRQQVRMLRRVDGRSGGLDFHVRAGQVVAVPEALARVWLERAWAVELDGHRPAEGRG